MVLVWCWDEARLFFSHADLALVLLECSARQNVNSVVVASSKKVDISKQGLNTIDNEVVKLNLMGKSKTMEKKDWLDASGRKGKVRFDCQELYKEYYFVLCASCSHHLA